MHIYAARGIIQRESGTPKQVDDPIGTVTFINADWDLHTMRKSKPFKPIPILSKIFSGI